MGPFKGDSAHFIFSSPVGSLCHIPLPLSVVHRPTFNAKPLKIFISNIAKQNSEILQTDSPRACVFKFCSNGGANYIISEIIAKPI